MALRYITIVLLGLLTSSLSAQVIELSPGSMADALDHLEKESDWLINYNPALVASMQLTSSVSFDPDQVEGGLIRLLKGHALDFEINGQVILIVPARERYYRICGNIKDANTGDPLELVNLFTSAYQGTWSDADGDFVFNDSISGTERIHLSYIGYADTSLLVSSFRSGCRDLTMTSQIQDFPMEVIVRGYFLPAITEGDHYQSIHMDMKAMRRELGAIEPDIMKTIQFMPGITSFDETASNISIRGSSQDQNLVLWEGSPLYGNGHLFGMISAINPFVVNDLQVHKDVYSPSYDNRIGGVLDIRLDDKVNPDWHGAIGTTSTEAHGELSIPILPNTLSLQVAGRRSIARWMEDNPTLESYGLKLFQSSEFFADAEEEEDDDEFTTDLTYSDFNGKLVYQPNDQWYWSTSYLGSTNSFENQFDFGIEDPAGVDLFSTQSSVWSNYLKYKWNDQASTTIQANVSNYSSLYEFSFNESSQSTTSILRSNSNDIKDIQFKVGHQFKYKNISLDGGYIYDFKNLSYAISEESRFEQDFISGAEQTGHFHHLYLNGQWHRDKWLLDAGGRLTYWNENQAVIFSPRFTLTRSISDHFNIHVSGGLFNQYIKQLEQFNQTALNIENKLWVIAAEDFMTSRKLRFGFNYKKNKWLVDVDGYHQHADGVPVLTTGQSSELEINALGTTTSRGIEVLVKRNWDQWHSALGYHMSEVSFLLPTEEDDAFPANNDQRHNLSWINYYKIKNWSIGLQYQYRSGLPFTQVNDLVLIEDDDDDEDYYEVEIDGLNDQRLPNFHRIDTYLGYQKRLASAMQLDLQLSLLNVFNFQKTTSRNYLLSEGTSTTEPDIFEVEKLQLGRTPQLLMRLSF